MEGRDELLDKYVRMQAELSSALERYELEAASARDRLALVEGMIRDMKALGAVARPAGRPAAAAASAPASTASVGLPMSPVFEDDAGDVSPAADAARVGRGRGKGRPGRPAAQRSDAQAATASAGSGDINDLSIVDAAIELAKKHGAREAKASDVQEWFEAAGYVGRNGTPNRNSIYVSLNREANQTASDPNTRLRKERRGVFTFDF